MTSNGEKHLPQRLESIQGLRGIAAFLVVLFHMASFQRQMAEGNPQDIALTSGIWDNGWVGVDLFFVISGFIMVYVTRNSGRTLKDVGRFITSRITRIYPLWWVCAGIMALYFWLTYGMPAAPDRVANTSEAMAFAVKSFMLIPQQAEPILGLGWTLIHEMFFYIVFACLLFIPRNYIPHALAIWAALTVIGAQFVHPAADGRNIAEVAASPLSLEFISGAFVGYLISMNKVFTPKLFLIMGVILACLGFLFYPDKSEVPYTILRVAIFSVPFIFLTYGWVGCELNEELSALQWLSRLGDWSYSLYLTHYIVLVALRRIYRIMFPEDLWVGATGIWDNIVFAVLSLALSVITASIFYNFIEKPSLKFFKKNRTKVR